MLQFGDREIRFAQDPFPLYPGEELSGEVEKLKVVKKDQAFRLQCLDDFDDNGTKRIAGDEWLFCGPKTYHPRKEVEIVSLQKAVTINPNEALKVKATREMKDHKGNIICSIYFCIELNSQPIALSTLSLLTNIFHKNRSKNYFII